MKATIRDSQTLELIRPEDVQAYLTAHAWHNLRPSGEYAFLYRRTIDNQRYDVLVPSTQEIDDFPQRIADIIRTLETVEDRSQIEILSDLTSTRSDVVRVRRPGAIDGTLPLVDGPDLVQSAYDMLLAAACSATAPRLYYQGKRPGQATDYISKARLGQSERGSYVLTVISPLPRKINENLFGKIVPFEREVTHLLSGGLTATVEAAEFALRQANTDHFREAAADGISANLLDAVLGLMGKSRSEVDINFAWSPELPVIETARPIEFDPDFVPVIEQASQFLKEQEPLPPVEIVGVVIGLRRPQGFDQGRATLLSFIDGKSKNVTLELPQDFYELAIAAHKERQPVICRGELVRTGRLTVLTKLTSFNIAPNLDDQEAPDVTLFTDDTK